MRGTHVVISKIKEAEFKKICIINNTFFILLLTILTYYVLL